MVESMRVSRFDDTKRGSFQVTMDHYDWELAIIIGSLRSTRLEYSQRPDASKAYLTYLERLEDKFSDALGKVLRAEFRDLKLGETRPLDVTPGGPEP